MLHADQDALVCDLAETYGIYDYRALPGRFLATLAVGLRDNSRIKMRLSGCRIPRSDVLLAAAVDRLSRLLWMLSENGQNGVNPPKSILSILLGEKEQENEAEAFDTPEEFEAEWTNRTGVSHGG